MATSPIVTIRPLAAKDEARWRVLWSGYLDFYKSSVPEAVYASTFARLLGDDAQDFHGMVAEQDGTIVGLVHYLFHRHCWRIENVCYLQDLYADPAVRGTGIGRKLIEAVYQAADEAGAPAVYWLTQEDNAVGRQLYDRVGQKTDFIKYARPA
ncbi:acetyltransferase (GNAT) family protein [Loktanella sp. PT4BL]|jgi:GNAT superfamily N-acetyltransferase|uniref:GNAT family N-acetyltransferase n=1 Tax=Loktanella sp. PT4BL TaxID=2135611 RepID=UPI000D775E8B|nr:GNAT family N-acetyltransferase [Loktanella sp. PT4BL]PXW70165.1 acetyltransferase (GNAT) family protein [Loktanella sp. PT4BL]